MRYLVLSKSTHGEPCDIGTRIHIAEDRQELNAWRHKFCVDHGARDTFASSRDYGAIKHVDTGAYLVWTNVNEIGHRYLVIESEHGQISMQMTFKNAIGYMNMVYALNRRDGQQITETASEIVINWPDGSRSKWQIISLDTLLVVERW